MAVTTITTTSGQDSRLVVAFGIQLGLGRNATQAEIKAAMIDYLRGIVFLTENQTAEAAALAGVTPPASFDPT